MFSFFKRGGDDLIPRYKITIGGVTSRELSREEIDWDAFYDLIGNGFGGVALPSFDNFVLIIDRFETFRSKVYIHGSWRAYALNRVR